MVLNLENGVEDTELLKLEQLERQLRPYRALLGLERPCLGWVRTIREGLGMTNAQLARRIGVGAPQSVEEMQRNEVRRAIKLETLHKLADALDCEFVYALVPRKPLQNILRERASALAQRVLKRVSHSMKLEGQGISREAQARDLNRRVARLLAGDPRKLWD